MLCFTFSMRMLSEGDDQTMVARRLQRFSVRHVPSKDCFVGLPPQLANQLHGAHDLPLAIQLREVNASGELSHTNCVSAMRHSQRN